jgi:hypothetical protein
MNSRRKELIEQYKQMKPEMGIFRIRSKITNKCFLETSQNLKGKINSTKFQLNAGAHPNRELQQEWKAHGEEQFHIEVLELLKYDKDEAKTDYSEELSILKLVWEEKLRDEKMEFYRKTWS